MMTRPEADLSWVVPLYRTGQYVEALAERCAAVSSELGLRHLMVFVDDKCPHESHREVEKIIDRHPVRLVRLPANQGQDGAIREGLRVAEGAVVVLDGDLQDPPEAAVRLWAALGRGHDAVFADRRDRYEGRLRLATSALYRRVMAAVAGLPRGAGLYVMMNASTAAAVAATRVEPVYILAALAATRGRFTSVEVARARRDGGESAYSGWRRLKKGVLSVAQAAGARHFGIKL